MRTRGRPSSYTKKIAAVILERLAAGESLRAICRDDKMPSETSVRRWAIDDVDGFSAHYAQARDIGLDTMADEILDIADNTSRDTTTTTNRDGSEREVADQEWINRSRLRVDARKWYLSKLAPKRYGDSSTLALTGPDGGPVRISDTERAAKIAAILAAGRARKESDAGDV